MRTIILPGAALLMTLASACSSASSDGGEIDTDGFKPGYNERDGLRYYCEYQDSTPVRSIPLGEARSSVTREVSPGLQALQRDDMVRAAKAAAIAQLRQRAPDLVVRASCALECVRVDEHDSSYGGGGSSGGAYQPSPPSAEDGASEVSTTNNQVAGVDEADFIKNDNQYLYVASSNAVQIIDAWPAAEAHTVATIPFIDSVPSKLFLGNDRLVVYSKVGSGAYHVPECTYGYDCVPTGDGTMTRVSIFDITDRANPRLTREFNWSGSLIAARKIGDAVHTVIYDAPLAERLAMLAQVPALEKGCYDETDDIEGIVTRYRALLDERVRVIEQIDDDGPSLREGSAPIEPQFYASNMPGDAFVSVVSFGISGASARAATVVGRPGFVYASDSALYMSVPHTAGENDGVWYSDMGTYARASEVHKFALGSDPQATRYLASGVVKGTVLNQFAMDEWGGHLRIATTAGRTPDPDVHSTVTVLAQAGQQLEQRGIVDNIAPTEDIRSVRFDGDRGFLVTFKKTDPLFAVDLANPAAPRITGELKIPGFSTYMQFMDRTHLLAIGLEADEQGSFAYFNGVQLQIFDIADMANPTLLHKTVIGTRGTTSEALTNHLGFNYFAPKDLLALPMTQCEGGGNGSYGNEMTFNGLLVYNVTTAAGFTKKGGVPHEVGPGVTCDNWWTNANSTVKRSVIMDDFVYSVAEDRINVANLNDLENPVASVELGR